MAAELLIPDIAGTVRVDGQGTVFADDPLDAEALQILADQIEATQLYPDHAKQIAEALVRAYPGAIIISLTDPAYMDDSAGRIY